MSKHSLLFIGLTICVLTACHQKKKVQKPSFSIKIKAPSAKIHKNEAILLSMTNKEEKKIDSVQYFYSGTYHKTGLHNHPVHLKFRQPLGRRQLSAVVFSDAQTDTLSKNIVVYAAKLPTLYTYKIVAAYPHDPLAFTQGLEFYNDTLYESTGLHGVSSLRQVDLKTGKVLKKVKLPRKYFGEGITILHQKIYWLTWQAGIGFVYDLHGFKKLKTFHYNQAKSKEGWGLCNNGKVLFKSDGTNKIWRLNPQTLAEESYIEPVTKNDLATRVNELEWVNGKIYANTWQKDGVLIINPKTGVVEGVIDFRGLKKKLGNAQEANVLNGIAYNRKTGKLYVTGKRWDKIFEVKIIKE